MTRHAFPFAAAVLALTVLATACSNGHPADVPPPDDPEVTAPADVAHGEPWRTEVLLDTGVKLSGVAVGDILPESPGNEIVVVGTDRTMRLIRRDGDVWRDEVIATLPGELIQVDVGDVDRARPGDEIVAVGVTSGGEDDPGARGAAVFVTRERGTWQATRVFEDTALLHGVCITDHGVWVAGYGEHVHLLGPQAATPWPAHSAALPGPGRSIARTTQGVVVACKDGSLVDVSLSGVVGPVPMPLDERGVGRARVAAADPLVLAADDDGTLTLLTRNESGAPARGVLLDVEDKLRGAVLADLDPTSPGLEAATAGYDGAIRVFARANGAWSGAVVAHDTDRFHHLTAGELPGWEGVVLVGVNYSGRVTVAGRPHRTR